MLPFFYGFTYLKEILCSVNTFSILTSQYFTPQGYSDNTSGFMGATMLLAGIVSSAITSPLFDRVLTRQLGRTSQILVPILSATWVSLIWAGKPPDSLVLHMIFGSDPRRCSSSKQYHRYVRPLRAHWSRWDHSTSGVP